MIRRCAVPESRPAQDTLCATRGQARFLPWNVAHRRFRLSWSVHAEAPCRQAASAQLGIQRELRPIPAQAGRGPAPPLTAGASIQRASSLVIAAARFMHDADWTEPESDHKESEAAEGSGLGRAASDRYLRWTSWPVDASARDGRDTHSRPDRIAQVNRRIAQRNERTDQTNGRADGIQATLAAPGSSPGSASQAGYRASPAPGPNQRNRSQPGNSGNPSGHRIAPYGPLRPRRNCPGLCPKLRCLNSGSAPSRPGLAVG